MTEDIETTERTHSGVTITGKAKMGSGTRDSATVKLKAKGKDAQEAIAGFEDALEAAHEGDWGHRLLELNPERSEDNE